MRERVAALVHQDVRADTAESARHAAFIGSRLIMGLGFVVGVVPCLAWLGTPSLTQALAFACGMLPLAAVGWMSRTGRFDEAHTLASLGLVGAAALLAVGSDALLVAPLAWLPVAICDALVARSRRAVLVSFAASVVALALIGVALMAGIVAGPHAGTGPLNVAILGLATLHMGVLALTLLKMQRRDAEALHSAMAYRNALAALCGDVVTVHDRSAAVVTAETQASGAFAGGLRDIQGRGLFELIHVADRPTYLKAIVDAFEHDKTAVASFRVRTGTETRDGFAAPIFTAMEIQSKRVALSEPIVVSVLRDRSDVERHAEQLAAMRQESEEAQAGKDRFLASVSHELRTPLNAIIGFAELLANEALAPRLPAKRQEYADIIRSSGEHLLSVVNSILDVSKLQAGRTEIDPEPIELGTLLDRCCDMVGLAAEQGGVELVRARPATAIELVADKQACRQIVLNLLSNAVKFTPCGGQVILTAAVESSTVVIEVRDTGIGMKQSDLARIGTPFFQVRDAYNGPFGGTGLGLSVVRGLVGLHGGTIAIESQIGGGTRIIVRLPADCRTGPARRAPPSIELLPRGDRSQAHGASASTPLFARIKHSA